MTNRVRILLADDHVIVRAGIRALLHTQPDMEVVGEAGTGEGAIQSCVALQPDIVVLDIVMPGMSGLEVARRIVAEAPGTRIIFLTMYRELHYLAEALTLGAAGYVLKTDVDVELVKAIRKVFNGSSHVLSEDAHTLMQEHVEADIHPDTSPFLSEREEQVLMLTARGYSNTEIAHVLNIGKGSVDCYRQRGMNKLGLDRRSELVDWALQKGFPR